MKSSSTPTPMVPNEDLTTTPPFARWRDPFWIGVVILYGCAILLFYEPITRAGFFSDDSVTCNWKDNLQLTGQTGFHFCVSQFRAMMQFQGRFAPVYNFVNTPLLLWIGDDLILYRIIHFGFTAASLIALAFLVNTILIDRKAGLIVALFFLSCIQIRSYHESLTSFGFVLQWVLIFSSLSLGFLIKGIRANRVQPLALSSVFYLLALLMSEFGLIVAVAAAVVCILEREESWRVRVLRWIPFLASSLVYLLITMMLKPDLNTKYTGTSFGSLHGIPRAWLIQMIGTLPLTYTIFDPNRVVHNDPAWVQQMFSLSSLMAGLTVTGSLYLLVRTLTPKEPRRLLLLSVLGVVMIVCPAALLSGSAKYQTELLLGLAYLPVYLQYAGYAMIVTSIVCFLTNCLIVNAGKRLLISALLIILILLSGVSFAVHRVSNSSVVRSENFHWKNSRELLGVALQQYGFGTSSNTTIVTNSPWLNRWENSNFLFRNSRIDGKFISLNSFAEDLLSKSDRHKYLDSSNYYYVDYSLYVRPEESTALVLARIRWAEVSGTNAPASVTALTGDHVMVVARSESGNSCVQEINIREMNLNDSSKLLAKRNFLITDSTRSEGSSVYGILRIPEGDYELTTYVMSGLETAGINSLKELPQSRRATPQSSSH